jgi:hypothetical protein
MAMNLQLPRLVAAQVCIHGCLTGLRMAAPLWALRTNDSGMIKARKPPAGHFRVLAIVLR